jgi:hypothetical protein
VLPARAGVHRWVWDLRYAAPESVTHGYPISAVPQATPQQPEGPLALPGRYVVRLTVDGRRLEAPLTLTQDPRVGVSTQALEEQLHLATRLATLLTDSSRTLLAAQSEEAQLKALAPEGPTADAVHGYQGRLAELLGNAEKKDNAQQSPAAAPPPNLKDVQQHIAGLYAEVTRADASPTAAQVSATDTAAQALSGLLDNWRKLQADLPDLNKRLQAAKLAPLRTDLPPPRDQNLADEE